MSKARDSFEALAHPMRRGILELLRERPGSAAGEIAAQFPEVSRVAVSKHVGILREARLVESRVAGRELRYTLDPTPLGELYERWLQQFEPLWEQSLRNLKRVVEDSPGATET